MIKSSTGTELVGYVFAFDFKKSQLSRNDVRTALADNCLDEDELPELSKRVDFNRAIRNYHRETKSETSLTFVSSDKNFIYFQINREEIETNAIKDSGSGDSVWIREKNIDPYIKIVYDVNENRIIVNDDYADAERVKAKLYQLLNIKGNEYNKAEVTSAIIRNLIKFGNAVQIIRGQKVYFVPAQSEKLLDRIETALKQMDGEVFISKWEAPKEERVIQSVTNSVVEKMQLFNDGYQKQIETFIENSKNMSDQNLQNKMDEIADNMEFLESYRDILGAQTDTLIKNLDATKAMLEHYNKTGHIVNPYREVYNKIKAKGYSPELEKEWFDAMDIPDDVVELLEAEYK